MAEAGLWVVWGVPARGRERQALQVLRDTMNDYLDGLQRDGRIERFDVAILKPQSSELGGFILIQGTRQQIEVLRGDNDFQVWVNQVQMVADKMGLIDAWVDEGLSHAFSLYEEAIRRQS
ncbi:MAG: hypothetical protein QOH57_2990 [Mycobacterium sp.]|jgi:hypothetical protein|nr:hypothetical protein [Mycobacterium sp.]